MSDSRVLSCNVSLPKYFETPTGTILTGIFKTPVEGRVTVSRLNLAGDQQADLSVHGGRQKAVYAYPAEHYEPWRGELAGMELPYGMFGENLTVTGLFEHAVRIGDRLRIGTALFQVSQPRMPCFKLAAKFGRNDIIKRMWASGRSGFYLSVVEEGELGAGDPIEYTPYKGESATIEELLLAFRGDESHADSARRALAAPDLPPFWREELIQRYGRL